MNKIEFKKEIKEAKTDEEKLNIFQKFLLDNEPDHVVISSRGDHSKFVTIEYDYFFKLDMNNYAVRTFNCLSYGKGWLGGGINYVSTQDFNQILKIVKEKWL